MRRPNGTGTIVKLSGKRRKPYVVRIPARDTHGYVIQKALSYHATAKEAQAALDEYNAKKAAGHAPAPQLLDYTVQQAYDNWSAREYKKLGEKGRKASISSHKAAWNKRVSRYGGRKMREVILDDWQSILDEDEDNGLSQSTINNDALLIRALYNYSMERDIVGKDYSQYLDIPSVDAKNPKGAFTDIQMEMLWQMAADGFPWADTVLMMCYTGFRITEFLTLSRFNYNPGTVRYFTWGIKTAAGRGRVVPIHPKIQPFVDKWLSRGGDTLIVSEKGTPLSSSWYRYNAFPSIVQALGTPEATPHWCRHTFSTRLYAAGVDEYTRRLLIGHSVKGNITAGYTHPTPDVLAKAIRKIA